MSNRQAIELLKQMDLDALQLVIATHLSEQNNCPKLVGDLLAETLGWPVEQIRIAEQDMGFEWHELVLESNRLVESA